jgi:antitoxin ParD1/3/4
MTITLSPDQAAWLANRVASGDFASAEDGVRQLVNVRIVEIELKDDDLEWTKRYVGEAIAAVERGEHVTLDQHNTKMAPILAFLKP